jgi:hypothetical protein
MIENKNTILPQIDGEMYDYRAAVAEDVRQYVEDEGGLPGFLFNHDGYNLPQDARAALMEENRPALESALFDAMFVSDAVTGNGSGSYWCSAYKATCALAYNMDLLADALAEFGADYNTIKNYLYSPEAADVTIRCYLLPGAISDYIETLLEDTDE